MIANPVWITSAYTVGMVYYGQVKDGGVVFETEPPPDGAAVRVEVVTREETAAGAGTPWSKLARYAGVVGNLPPDMASNHNHYIHGGTKE